MIRVPFVLASGSPRRRKYLSSVVRSFEVKTSHVPEPPPRRGVTPRRYALDLAEKKAREVARKISTGLILGADTIVVQRGIVFGKPSSIDDARQMLEQLSGRWHHVYTALALVAQPGGKCWKTVSRTDVKMKNLSLAALERWSKTNHDKAGAYAAQAKNNPFIDKIRGDHDNVVGLPRRNLRQLLSLAGKAGFGIQTPSTTR